MGNWDKSLKSGRVLHSSFKPLVISVLLHVFVFLTAMIVWPKRDFVLQSNPAAMKARLIDPRLFKSRVPPKKAKKKLQKKVVENKSADLKKESKIKEKEMKSQHETENRPDPEIESKKSKIITADKKLKERTATRPEKGKNERIQKQKVQSRDSKKQTDLPDKSKGGSKAHDVTIEKDQITVDSYVSLIQTLVIRHWNRPASARKSMKVKLRVRLTPTGEIISINMTKSSGSEVFDNSAIKAVEDAAPFRELMQLENRLFEEAFREFNLNFDPQDLLE